MNQANNDTGSNIDNVKDENSEMCFVGKELDRQYKYQRYTEAK